MYYGLYPDLNPSVSDVMYDGVDNPEVFVTPERSLFITPEEFDIPDIPDVTDDSFLCYVIYYVILSILKCY